MENGPNSPVFNDALPFDVEESAPTEAMIPRTGSEPTETHLDIIEEATPTEIRILTYIHLGDDEIAEKLNMDTDDVRKCIKTIQVNNQATPKDLVLAPYFAGIIDLKSKPKNATGPDRHQKPLSSREVEVFAMKANGYSKKEISKELGISFGTVGTHLSGANMKLGGSSLRTNIFYAHQNGINLDLF